MGEYEGTITSKMRPIVTSLTEALIKDFVPSWQLSGSTDLREDVKSWLLGIEEDMTEESDRIYARMVVQMVRKNPGWIDLLTERVRRKLNSAA